jgi:hypothetical protein
MPVTNQRHNFLALSAAAVLLTSCGGGSSDQSGSDAAGGGDSGEQTFDGVLGNVTEAIEANDYTCQPESMAMTSAERAICNTFSSIGVSAYVWADAETLESEIDSEIMCTSDSHLGEIRYLRGDTWAASAFSLSESTADKSTEIDEILSALQNALGGELASKPCS